jgi:hypothetical protein
MVASRAIDILQELLLFVVMRGIAIAVLQIVTLILFLAAPAKLYW